MKILIDCGGRDVGPASSRAFDLTGKQALVTGCRRGIGLAMAEALAGAGADIVGVSAHLEPSGSDVAAARRGRRAQRSPATASTSRGRDEVAAFAREIAAGERPIDILVNNAGTIARAPPLEHDDDDVGDRSSRST